MKPKQQKLTAAALFVALLSLAAYGNQLMAAAPGAAPAGAQITEDSIAARFDNWLGSWKDERAKISILGNAAEGTVTMTVNRSAQPNRMIEFVLNGKTPEEHFTITGYFGYDAATKKIQCLFISNGNKSDVPDNQTGEWLNAHTFTVHNETKQADGFYVEDLEWSKQPGADHWTLKFHDSLEGTPQFTMDVSFTRAK